MTGLVSFLKTEHIIKTILIIPGRILLVGCFYESVKMRILNVYTPSDSSTKVRIKKKQKNNLLVVGYHTILCGDFNACTVGIDRIPLHLIRSSTEG